MAYLVGGLFLSANLAPGRNSYNYHSTDHPDVVEAANYFNNKTNNLNLGVGDRIEVNQWSATPFAAGSTISRVVDMKVTNVIDQAAAANAGAVNIAQILTTELLSSGT